MILNGSRNWGLAGVWRTRVLFSAVVGQWIWATSTLEQTTVCQFHHWLSATSSLWPVRFVRKALSYSNASLSIRWQPRLSKRWHLSVKFRSRRLPAVSTATSPLWHSSWTVCACLKFGSSSSSWTNSLWFVCQFFLKRYNSYTSSLWRNSFQTLLKKNASESKELQKKKSLSRYLDADQRSTSAFSAVSSTCYLFKSRQSAKNSSSKSAPLSE